VGILLVLVVVAAMIAFLRKKEFQITDVTVVGAQAMDASEVVSVVKASLAGNRLAVIPRSNTLLLSKISLRSEILAALPVLSDASIQFKGRNTLKVSVVEKDPEYVWCEGEVCYFVDEQGVLYGEAPVFSDGVYIILSRGNVDAAHPAGMSYLPREDMSMLGRIVKQLEQYPAHVLGVDVRKDGDVALRIDSLKGVSVNSQAFILVAKTDTVQSVNDALNLIMGDKGFVDTLKAKGEKLEYVDLRFPGKIYYKFAS
jgi:hypothetical protein